MLEWAGFGLLDMARALSSSRLVFLLRGREPAVRRGEGRDTCLFQVAVLQTMHGGQCLAAFGAFLHRAYRNQAQASTLCNAGRGRNPSLVLSFSIPGTPSTSTTPGPGPGPVRLELPEEAQAWPRSSQVLFCARDDASCQCRGRGQWSSTRWRGRGDEEDGEDDRDEGDEKSEVSSAMLADDLLSLSVVEEAQGWMELDVAGSGRSPPRTRHRGMQREWPRGVFTEGWSTARSDRWVHEGRGWGARRMEGRGSETTKGMMRSTGTTSTRMRNGNSSSGRGARSPYSENIHSEAHPCEVVAEGVLLRLSPGRRKCC